VEVGTGEEEKRDDVTTFACGFRVTFDWHSQIDLVKKTSNKQRRHQTTSGGK
jgi:hypothetical protein